MTTPPTEQEPTPLTDEDVAGIERYWEQPTGHYAAPPGMVEAARFNIGQMRATIDSLRSDLAALFVRVEEAEGERDRANARADRHGVWIKRHGYRWYSQRFPVRQFDWARRWVAYLARKTAGWAA